MPRTKGAQHIQGWREHGLIRDLGANVDNIETLAEKYDVALQIVYAFKERHNAQ
jgi:hypothetical protein